MIAARMRRLLPLLAFAVVHALACPARAQDANAAAADALFQSGKLAMQQADYDVACERFRESFRLQAAPGTLLNVGACEEKRGHLAVALQCFRDSLALMGEGDFRRSFAEEQVTALRARVASARIVVDGAPPPALRIAQDDVALGVASLGVEIPVDPGKHVFTASAPGFEIERIELTLASGEQRSIVFRLRPGLTRGEASQGPPPATPGPGPGPGPGPYVLLGSGLAIAAAGSVFGLIVMNASSEVRDHCDATGCDATGLDAAARGRRYSVLSPVLLATGTALAGGGVLWLYLFRSSRVKPMVSAGHESVAASLRGTF